MSDAPHDLLDSLKNTQPPEGKGKEALWQEIEARTQQPPARKIRRLPLYISAAAVLLVLLGVFTVYRWYQPTTWRAGAGELLAETLPDGSQVQLNAGSQLQFYPRQFGQKRHLTLTGEAQFEVVEGKPFTVQAGELTIQVLGTRFNVRVRSHTQQVQCYQGLVQVQRAGSQLQITAGQMAQVTRGQLRKKHLAPNQQGPDWLQGRFSFMQTPLFEVVNELERQLALDIALQADSARLYTGTFTRTHPQQALQQVCRPMNLQFTLDTLQGTAIIRNRAQ